MYIAIDQYGNKTILKDKKYSTLKDKFYCGNIQKMYIDSKDNTIRHIGYILGQGRGNNPLWIELFKMIPLDKVKEI